MQPNDLLITCEDIKAYLESNNQLSFDDTRKHALKGWDDFQACPGSGKTTLIGAKLAILAKKWTAKHQGICVLTHTNVACDEIKERLVNDPHGHKLLSYPHFIGTIQEFVNKYLGIPHLRSRGLPITQIDDEACEQYAQKSISQTTRAYLKRKRVNSLHALRIDKKTGACIIPSFQNKSNSESYKNLKNSLRNRLKAGYFCFDEMYYFSNKTLKNNDSLNNALQIRFPIVLLDEMQDTQKYQDELINNIFNGENVKIQRFGDPDQAIFDGIGGDTANESFNKNTSLQILNHSHRFTQDIADKVTKLSLSQLERIEAKGTPTPARPHTIFIYKNGSKASVLDAFANLVKQCDPNQNWKVVKAVGATEGQDGHISAYWPKFEKNKQVTNPKPKTLIDAVKANSSLGGCHTQLHYQLLNRAILDLLRIADIKDTRTEPQRYFNPNSMKSWLLENNKYEDYRKLITNWILSPNPTQMQWEGQAEKLKDLLGINSQSVSNFLAYNANPDKRQGPPDTQQSLNIFTGNNGRKIEVGTIHSVKGETHDATLVLETKNHDNDIHKLLDYLAEKNSGKITGKRKIKFARQLYVACSRPRHLLCLAIDKEHITDDQKEKLEKSGWSIQVV